MAWEKCGLIFKPEVNLDWIFSHAQVPTVLVTENSLRVYYAGRNTKGKSFTTFIDLDLNDPSKILYIHKAPVLSFGLPGTFDDDGVMPSHALKKDGKIYLYYTGWNQRLNVGYHNSIGVAVSEDGGINFKRVFDGPIMDRTATEPYIAVTPCIIRDSGKWHMWYASGTKWALIGEKYEPVYIIKYAHSEDGFNWIRPNITCVKPHHELEAFARPYVIMRDNIFCMWYCYRNSENFRDGNGSYRIGYSESINGIDWTRKDDAAGIALSENSWDSTMLCYPCVVRVKNKQYLFYNGNGFGRSGFGYAIWN